MADPMRLVVSIDTEEDNWVPAQSGISVRNIDALRTMSRFLERLGVHVTYFTTYRVAADPWSAAIMREIAASPSAEIAAHVHPWNTPPTDEPYGGRNLMVGNLPRALQSAKIGRLTELFAERFGERPRVFRAGRFGVAASTLSALVEHGYRVDSSVTPFWNWSLTDFGPDFRNAPCRPYVLSLDDICREVEEGPLVEVPVSSGFTGIAYRHWGRAAALLDARLGRAARAGGFAARLGRVKRTIMSPEVESVRDMLRLTDVLLGAGIGHIQMFFHSPSLTPGLGPFSRTQRDVRRLYDRIERYVDQLGERRAVQFETVSMAASCVRESRTGASPRSTAKRTQARPRRRRLVVISYHFPPDGAVGGLRWSGLSKFLSRTGWDVRVITASAGADAVTPDLVRVVSVPPRRTLNHLYLASKARLTRREAAGPEPAVSGSRTGAASGWLERVRSELGAQLVLPDYSRGWILRCADHAHAMVRRLAPDALITSGPPHAPHLAGWLAARKSGTPWIVDLRDPWISTNHTPGRWDAVQGTRSARTLVTRMERFTFTRARAALANTVELQGFLRERYPSLPVFWVPNAVDRELLPRPRRRSRFEVVYVGTVYGKRSLHPILRAFRGFLDRYPNVTPDQVAVRIAGQVDMEHRRELEQDITEARIGPFVETLGLVPREDALDLTAGSAVSVVLAQDQEMQVPAKLYEISGIGVPTLVVAEEGSATWQEAGRLHARRHRPDDVAGIVDFIERSWKGAPDPAESGGGRDYARVAADLERILESVISGVRGPGER